MKKIIKEFKEFAIKGNVFDMAIGIIVGTAFSKVVSSLVSDIISPCISYFTGEVDFTSLAITIKPEQLNEQGKIIQEAVAINYGSFLQTTIDFVIIAFCIFSVIKLFNSLKRKSENVEDKTVSTPKDIELLTEIRDLLKSDRK
jgi:large conductance mechanosensitive channel